MIDESLAAALVFAVIFLFGGRLPAVSSRRAALSLASGASIAYVFVRLLPELGVAGSVFVAETEHLDLPIAELRIYLMALVGFVIFYGLEHMVARSRGERVDAHGEKGHEAWVFGLHVAGFAFYGSLVSYLMVRGITDEPTPVALYAFAMGLHFLAVDHSLAREHASDYHRMGRFILAGAVVFGWAVAMLIDIPRTALIPALGLVSGGVVMNSMIMELPSERDGRFLPFLVGAVAYAALLAAVR